MPISKRCEYALRALIDIGLAHEMGRPLLSISDLAEHEQIPSKFLEQILLQLREAGYLKSTRGRNGGYSLGRPLASIHMGDVTRLIDGPLAPIRCVSRTAYAACSCPDEDHCGLRMLMLDVRNAVSSVLDRHTLADVVAITLRKLRRDRAPVPFGRDTRRSEAGRRHPGRRPATRPQARQSRAQSPLHPEVGSGGNTNHGGRRHRPTGAGSVGAETPRQPIVRKRRPTPADG